MYSKFYERISLHYFFSAESKDIENYFGIKFTKEIILDDFCTL
jgi:hypothetical protein